MNNAAMCSQRLPDNKILSLGHSNTALIVLLTKRGSNTRGGRKVSKSKLIQIEDLYLEMKTLTLKAGVPESQLNEVTIVDPEIINDEILTERLDFLKEVRKTTYEEIRKVWTLVPPETWEMYELLGHKRLAEQTLLRKKMKALKKSWSDRYGRTPQQEHYHEEPSHQEADSQSIA
jgi:hypothetical protein